MLSFCVLDVKHRLFPQLRVLDNAISDGEDYPGGSYDYFK
jgi:hypothetical protein